jgi:hypothetical protein
LCLMRRKMVLVWVSSVTMAFVLSLIFSRL